MRKIVGFIFLWSGVTQAQHTSKLSILFTGDIMQHQVQITTAFNPELRRYDYFPCFKFVKPYLTAADLTIDAGRVLEHVR